MVFLIGNLSVSEAKQRQVLQAMDNGAKSYQKLAHLNFKKRTLYDAIKILQNRGLVKKDKLIGNQKFTTLILTQAGMIYIENINNEVLVDGS